MPANTIEEAKASAKAAAESASQLASQAERRFAEATKRFEKVVADGLDQIKAQTHTYTDNAGEHIDEASRYVAERVREKPLVAAGTALGVGILLGLLLAGGRSR